MSDDGQRTPAAKRRRRLPGRASTPPSAPGPGLPSDPDRRLRDLLQGAPIGIAELTADGIICASNRELAAMIGVTVGDLTGRSWLSLIPEGERERVMAALGDFAAIRAQQTGDVGARLAGEQQLLRADGSTVPGYVYLGALATEHEHPAEIIAVVLDRSVGRAGVRTLERNERLLTAAERFARLGSWQQDFVTGESTWSAGMCRLLGHDPDTNEPSHDLLLSLLHPQDRTKLSHSGLQEGGEASLAEDVRLRGLDGRERTLSVRIRPVRNDDGNLVRLFGTALDVTETRALEAQLRSSEERFRLAFDNAPIGMALVSARPATLGRFLKVNHALCRLSGYSIAELLGMDVRVFSDSDITTAEAQQIADLLDGEASFLRDERRCRHADGHDIWIRMSASLVRDAAGDPHYCVLQVEDITGRKQAEQRLIHQTLHDALTGLPNRVLLSDHLSRALARAHRSGTYVGVLFVDLDNFKDVNDSLGHDAGDELLIGVAHRLRGCLRDTDTAARLGGDEFVVVCEDLADREEASAVAERVEQALDITIDVREQKVGVSASLGIAISDGADRAEDMMRKADSAMYRAKEHGRGRFEVFDPDLQARALRQVSLETELRRALAGDELRLHYQACFDLMSGALVGVEALLRWQHPQRGLLKPMEFLDVAEDRRLMIPLGEWVLRAACAQAGEWHRRFGSCAPEMSINISSRQLGRRELVRVLEEVLAEQRVPAHRLCLELTERQVLSAAPDVQDDLDRLSGIGVMLAVDDFGTGFANIDYLRRVPFRVLKMDRSYVGGLGADRTDTALTAGIVALGHALDLTVVAEGVETPGQREQLCDLGCDQAQGFLLHRPEPAAAVTRLLSATASRRRQAISG